MTPNKTTNDIETEIDFLNDISLLFERYESKIQKICDQLKHEVKKNSNLTRQVELLENRIKYLEELNRNRTENKKGGKVANSCKNDNQDNDIIDSSETVIPVESIITKESKDSGKQTSLVSSQLRSLSSLSDIFIDSVEKLSDLDDEIFSEELDEKVKMPRNDGEIVEKIAPKFEQEPLKSEMENHLDKPQATRKSLGLPENRWDYEVTAANAIGTLVPSQKIIDTKSSRYIMSLSIRVIQNVKNGQKFFSAGYEN